MNRREAITALMALPVARIQRADLQPDDVLVVEIDGAITESMAAHIKASLAAVFPDHRAVICADGMRLKVLTRG